MKQPHRLSFQLHSGQIDDNEESTDFALVSTAADSALSVKRYGELIDAQNIVVDPSWVLDSVENGILMNEEDYMIFETEANDSLVSSAPLPLPDGSSDTENPGGPEEPQKEENEFLLQAIVHLHAKEWLDIYTWCAENVRQDSYQCPFSRSNLTISSSTQNTEP